MPSPDHILYPSLPGLIRKVCNGIPSERETSEFVTLCLRIVCGYLRYLSSRGYRLLPPGGTEAELEDLAADTVADLFRRDAAGRFDVLARYFRPLLDGLDSAADGLPPLRALLVSRAKQGLSRIFRERDPETARLLRMVRLAVSRAPGCILVRRLGMECILMADENGNPDPDRLFDLPVMGLPESGPPAVSASDDTPGAILKIRDAFRLRGLLPASVPVMDVVLALRALRRGADRIEAAGRAAPALQADRGTLEEDIRDGMRPVLAGLAERLDAYVARGVMDGRTASGFRSALDAMFEDMLAQGAAEPHLDYLSRFLPDLDPAEYRRGLRVKFEYCVRTLKKGIVEIAQIG